MPEPGNRPVPVLQLVEIDAIKRLCHVRQGGKRVGEMRLCRLAVRRQGADTGHQGLAVLLDQHVGTDVVRAHRVAGQGRHDRPAAAHARPLGGGEFGVEPRPPARQCRDRETALRRVRADDRTRRPGPGSHRGCRDIEGEASDPGRAEPRGDSDLFVRCQRADGDRRPNARPAW
ncbi:MAG: hypothetical protein JKP98_24815 [Rhodobacteraceae bacterium]|nr:hypothetical protein [Paracoccaceae bacterium]